MSIFENEVTLSPEGRYHLYLFRKCLPLRVKLRETLRALGDTARQTCLVVGADNAMVSHYLQRNGGEWHTAVTTAAAADFVKAVVGERVHVLEGQRLPFENKTFDAVAVMGVLERIGEHEAFIEECHRILKPDGRLVVNVAHVKNWTLMKPLRRLLGVTYEKRGYLSPGYTESQLFGLLKDGFDVLNMRSYSRLCVECVDLAVQAITGGAPPGSMAGAERLMRTYAVASPFYWLAFQLDLLLFFTRGHTLIATSKRRTWRSRKAPVLVDGRSISEAVLTKAAD